MHPQFHEQVRRNTPDFGFGRGGQQDDPFREIRQQIAGQPEVQMTSKIIGGIIGLAALGAVMYDWCTTDPGKAGTSIDFEGGSSVDSKRNATRYTGGTTVGASAGLTTVKVTTKEELIQE